MKRVKRLFVFMCLIIASKVNTVLATSQGGGTFSGGTPDEVVSIAELLKDATMWGLLLVPLSATVMIIYHSIRKIVADGEHGEIADRNKKIKGILVTAVIAFIASGIVTIITGYFV